MCKFIEGQKVSFTEGFEREFKTGSGKPGDVVARDLNVYVVAYLNTGIDGSIYWGITDHPSEVKGLRISRRHQDLLRQRIGHQIAKIKPIVQDTLFKIEFHEVWVQNSVTHELEQKDNRVILEIHVYGKTNAEDKVNRKNHYCADVTINDTFYKDCYVVKTHHGKQPLTLEEIQQRYPIAPSPGPPTPDPKSGTRGKSRKSPTPPKPTANPYDFSLTASEDMFKGRSKEIDQLMGTIQNGGHRVIYGLQRMGKTSLVEAVEKKIGGDPILKKDFLFITVNFQQFGGHNTTYWAVLNAIVESIAKGISSRRLDIVKGEINDWVNQNQASINTLSMRLKFREILVNTVKSTRKKIVLFLDEFSELCHAIHKNENTKGSSGNVEPDEVLADVDLMRWFRVLIDEREITEKLVPIIAARPFVSEYDNQMNLELLRLMNPITLYHLDEKAAKELITEPLSEMVKIEEKCVDYLYKLTAGHPYLIQFFLQNVIINLPEKSRIIKLQDIEDVENKMISEVGSYTSHFGVLESDYSLDVLDKESNRGRAFLEAGQHFLALMANAAGKEGDGWVQTDNLEIEFDSCKHPVVAQTLLNQLEYAKILERREHHGELEYRISVPLLRKKYFRQANYTKSLGGSATDKVVTVHRPKTGVA